MHLRYCSNLAAPLDTPTTELGRSKIRFRKAVLVGWSWEWELRRMTLLILCSLVPEVLHCGSAHIDINVPIYRHHSLASRPKIRQGYYISFIPQLRLHRGVRGSVVSSDSRISLIPHKGAKITFDFFWLLWKTTKRWRALSVNCTGRLIFRVYTCLHPTDKFRHLHLVVGGILATQPDSRRGFSHHKYLVLLYVKPVHNIEAQ